jgi:pimeloyl-ACP methyl ester carboxylesterase
VWLHHVEAVGAALRYFALDGLRPPVVMVTGMGLAAVENYLPTLAHCALRRRRLLFVDPFACGYSDAPVSFSYSLREQAERSQACSANAPTHPAYSSDSARAARSPPCSPTSIPSSWRAW